MLAIVFPGQGSQRPGMGQALYETQETAQDVFDRVGQATGVDVARLCFETDEETLRCTENAQLALYTTGLAAYAVERPVEFVAAGHSVGEYAALVAAGGLSLEDGARAVRRRGELMAQAGDQRPGGMAAVLGLSREEVENALAEVTVGTVVVANDNCPGQLVISGDRVAVEAAAEPLRQRGAKRVLPLNVSGAFHSPLMEEPAREMGEFLRGLEFRTPFHRVYANVTAEPETGGWADLLERQLRQPVRWTETVLHLVRDGVTRTLELGGGDVLSGLVRRTSKDVEVSAFG